MLTFTRTLRGFLLLGAVSPAIVSGCGGEDNCLVEGENCTSAYVKSKYGDDRDCCSGLSCKEGTSGILICK